MIIVTLFASVAAVALCVAAVNLGRVAAATERISDALERGASVDIGIDAPVPTDPPAPDVQSRGLGGGGRR